jgi:hypothetical protein
MTIPSLLKGSIKNAVKKLLSLSQTEPDTPLTNSLQVDTLWYFFKNLNKSENLRKMLEESLQLGVSFTDVVELIQDKESIFKNSDSLDSTLVMIQISLNNKTFVDLLQKISKLENLSNFYQQRSFFFSEEEMTFLTSLFLQLKSLTFNM